MSVEQIYRSDLTGQPIDGVPVTVKIFENGHLRVLDMSTSEVRELFGDRGRVQKKRGRKATVTPIRA